MSDIEKRANYDEIKAVYEAESGLMKEQKIVELYNKQRRESLREDAMEALENSDDWKDKKHGVMYARETQQRNIQDIVNDSTDADLINARYFDPVKKNEADKTRYINEMTERVKAFGLNKWESKAAQMVGEKASYEESLANGTDDSIIEMYEEGLSDVNDALEKLLEKHGKDIDLAKCENAAKEMRPIFEELFEKANEALIRNGYAPIEHRKGYFPHFIGAEDSTVRAELFNVLGKNQNDIPTDIAGLTATFRPGKTWFGNALERVGITTTYEDVELDEEWVAVLKDLDRLEQNHDARQRYSTRLHYDAFEFVPDFMGKEDENLSALLDGSPAFEYAIDHLLPRHREILFRRASKGEMFKDIGKSYGVSASAIHHYYTSICARFKKYYEEGLWLHSSKNTSSPQADRVKTIPFGLTPAQVMAIRAYRCQLRTLDEIAELVGVPRNRVKRCLHDNPILETRCPACGKAIPQVGYGVLQKFCNSQCYFNWFRKYGMDANAEVKINHNRTRLTKHQQVVLDFYRQNHFTLKQYNGITKPKREMFIDDIIPAGI